MKHIHIKIKIALLIIFISPSAFSQVLNVPLVTQEQDEWCWAAVSKSILNYYGDSVSQCQIAEYTRETATWNNFGNVDCCTDPSQGCNYWNYPYGYTGSIQDILQNWGVQNYGIDYPLTPTEIAQEISGSRPFIIRWGWTAGGGHFLVGHGFIDSTLYYMNPWFGEGYKFADYSWVLSNADHEWTHGNLITTNVSAFNKNLIEKSQYSVYPNPSHNNIIIDFTGENKPSGVICEIQNTTGQTIKKLILFENRTIVDIKNINSGIYFLKLTTDKDFVIERIIKL